MYICCTYSKLKRTLLETVYQNISENVKSLCYKWSTNLFIVSLILHNMLFNWSKLKESVITYITPPHFHLSWNPINGFLLLYSNSSSSKRFWYWWKYIVSVCLIYNTIMVSRKVSIKNWQHERLYHWGHSPKWNNVYN